MARCFLFLLLFSIVRPALCQQPVFLWAKQFGSSVSDDTYYDVGKSIALDAQGNVYSAGIFFNTIDFDPGPGVYNLDGGGLYISKLSADGDFIWAKKLSITLTGALDIKTMDLTVDKNGNIYFTSHFLGTVDFDPGAGVHNLSSPLSQQAFILKLTTNGDFVWVRQFVGPCSGASIDIDKDNNPVIGGSFWGIVDFDPGAGTAMLRASGILETFITKLTANGDFVWARNLGGFPVPISGFMDMQDIKCDRLGNTYVTGWFKGLVNFEGGFSLLSDGINDGFVAKVDANSNVVWARKLGNSTGGYVLQPRAIAIDNNNNIYTAGKFTGTQDFDAGDNIYQLTAKGGSDAFVLKMNPSGDFTWARGFGGHLGAGGSAFDIAIDNDNNVYTVGGYSGTCDFDPGPLEFLYTLLDDAVLTKFDVNGNFRYASAFTSDIDGLCNGRRLATDSKQNIHITGEFGGTIDFDPGAGMYNLIEKKRYTDAYVVKLARCTGITTSSFIISTCENYTLNNETYDTTGIYTQILPNSLGCDSIITLDLTINRKIIKQSIAICEGSFFHVGGADQTRSGTYTDSFKTSSGCDSVIITALSVVAKPQPDLGPDKDLCGNAGLRVTPGAFSRYRWQDGSTNNSLLIQSVGTFWVTVTNSANCTATDSLKISAIIPAPVDFLKAVDSVCALAELQIQSLKNYPAYAWSTGGTEKSIRVDKPGIYWLTVTDDKGCKSRDTITVVPKECLIDVFIPTGFTPNGDGKNDYFRAVVPLTIQTFRLEIFHRDGHLIFQTTDPAKKWNGTYKGVTYSSQTFVWQCFYQLKDKPPAYQKGTVTLIR